MKRKWFLRFLACLLFVNIFFISALAAIEMNILEEPPARTPLTPGEVRVRVSLTTGKVDLEQTELKLNGEKVELAYDPKTGELFYSDRDLATGNYELVLKVVDTEGRVTEKDWSFKVLNPFNLLINPTFEENGKGWAVPSGNWAVDPENKFQGTNSMKADAGGYSYLNQTIPVVGGATYRISFYAKKSGSGSGRFSWDDGNGYTHTTFTTQDTWQEIVKTVQVAADAEVLKVAFAKYTYDILWIAMVSVMKVDDKAPQIDNLIPAEGETVTEGRPKISARITDEKQGSDIDLDTLRITLNGRELEFFYNWDTRILQADLPPGLLEDGMYNLEITVSDRALPFPNTARKSWSFEVLKTSSLVIDKTRISADGIDACTIKAIFRDVEEGTLVEFTTTKGELSSTNARTNEEGIVTTKLTGTEPGFAIITVKQGNREMSTEVEIYAGEVIIGKPQTAIRANGKDQTDFLIKVLNMYGKPAAGASITANIDAGSVALPANLNSRGEAVGTITAGNSVGLYTLIVIAEIDDHTLIAEREIAFLPGSFEINVNSFVIAKGGDKAAIQLQVYDKDGELVADGTKIEFLTTLGLVNGSSEGFVETSAGLASLEFVSEEPGAATIIFRWGLLEEKVIINVVETNQEQGIRFIKLSPVSFAPRQGEEMQLSYILAEPYRVSINIYNLAGRRVRTLISNSMQEAELTHFIKWDGKDDYGFFLNNGLYLIEIKTDKKVWTVRRVAIFN